MRFIAIAGKGGTGKTTLSALLIGQLLKRKKRAILAIDADPNSNLDRSLGVTPDEAIADIIDETRDMPADRLPAGMTRDRYIELRLQQALTEARGFDLLVMGRPEGPGCYCYANSLLQRHIGSLTKSYEYVVMDNEAGMEHLSRRTAREVDRLLLVSDPSRVGVQSAVRLSEMARELKVLAGDAGLVLNRCPQVIPPALEDFISVSGLKLWGRIPLDSSVMELEVEGRSLLELPDDSPAVKSVGELLEKQLAN